MPAVRRVGHKGADALAPGNTAEAFAAGAAAGVDMLEFDVLSEALDGTGELRLAHDPDDLAARPGALTLEQALEHLAGDAYAELELDVDLKLPGYELRVLDALRRHDLLGRSLVCSTHAASLRVLRAAAPELRLGFSYPALRSDPTTRPGTKYAALAAATAARRVLPAVFARRVRRGEFDAVMIHWRLFSPALLRAVRRAGGQVYVWTVDDGALVQRLVALGVDGVITNDPRLFGAATRSGGPARGRAPSGR
jgi:glycerophosphoryl diester phosphodiesterase